MGESFNEALDGTTVHDPVIVGGTIDDTPIGQTTPAAGDFEPLTVIAPAATTSFTGTISAATRTATFTETSDYDLCKVGSVLIADGDTRIIVALLGSDQVTVDADTTWGAATAITSLQDPISQHKDSAGNVVAYMTASGELRLLDNLITNTSRKIPKAHAPSAGSTLDLNMADGTLHDITMPAGNIALTVSNEIDGHIFTVRILQDAVGSRTVTWFNTIKWAGGSAPTLTTTANKADTFVFRVTGADTYDGFIVGQNI